MLPVSRVTKEPLLICSLVVLLLSLATNADELLGARCHTNCLHQLETRAFVSFSHLGTSNVAESLDGLGRNYWVEFAGLEMAK